MGSKNRYEGIDKYAVEVVRYRAQKLVGKAGYRDCDVEDIEQDLMLDLVERLAKFDEAKAQLTTFVDRIVDHKIANLLEQRLAAKRDYRQARIFLDEAFEKEDGHPSSLLEITSMDDYLDRMGFQDRTIHDHHILRIDLEAAFHHLDDDEQRLLGLLREMTLAEAARELGVARTTLAYQLRKIGKKLENMGLDEGWRR